MRYALGLGIKKLPTESFDYKKLAKEDGFNNWVEFGDFFIKTYKLPIGGAKDFVIIKWRDFVPAKHSSHACPVGWGDRFKR